MEVCSFLIVILVEAYGHFEICSFKKFYPIFETKLSKIKVLWLYGQVLLSICIGPMMALYWVLWFWGVFVKKYGLYA